AGKRTTVKRDLSAPQKDEARIALGGSSRPIKSVVIDRYRLRSPIGEVHIIRLRAGRHAIELDFDVAASASQEIDLHAGSTFDVAQVIAVAPAKAPEKESKTWPYFAGGGGVAAAVIGCALIA